MAGVSRGCVRRLQRELAQLQSARISSTVYIVPHGDDITTIDALIIGPPDTPYDGAMLHFRLRVPPEYPLKPPQVRFMTTDGGSLRIHPQLYADGKVCLSILGTWHGPKWTASQSVSTVLLSIQSLLNEEPLRCEPGLENSTQEAVDQANIFVAHEATRVLINGALSGTPSWGRGEDFAPLTAAMHSHLRERRSAILERLASLSAKHDKQVLREPFVFSTPMASRRYDFATLSKRLQELLPASEDAPAAEPPSGAQGGSSPSREPGRRRRRQEDQEPPEDSGSSSDEDGAKAHCRICHQTAEESGQPLITPCRCSGSIRYAHAKCVLNWLEYSGQVASAKYHCDICRMRFRVTLGGGKPVGYAYLHRDADVLDDPGFDAPGLVATLFTSFAQILATTVGRVVGQSIHGCSVLICSPLPEKLGGPLLVACAVPVLLVEVLTYGLYLILLGIKVGMLISGPQWRPSDWGEFGEERIGYILNTIADNLFAMGLCLDGVIVLSLYFTVTHICGQLGCGSLIGWLVRTILGPERGAYMLAMDTGLDELLPVLKALFPGTYAVFMKYVHFPVGIFSVMLNVFSIAWLLRMAFVDLRPVPIDVLPASTRSLVRNNKRRVARRKKAAAAAAAAGEDAGGAGGPRNRQ